MYIVFRLSDLQEGSLLYDELEHCGFPYHALCELSDEVKAFLEAQGFTVYERPTNSNHDIPFEIVAEDVAPATTFCVKVDDILSPRDMRWYQEHHRADIVVSDDPLEADYTFELS